MERTWATREQLILEAVADAQEHGRDVVSVARAAVPDLPGDLYMETLASLEDDGFLQVATIRDGAGRLHGAHVQRLTPKGRRQVGQWPSDDVVTELLAGLQAKIDAEPDPVERSRLERLRDAAGEVSRSVLSAVVTAAAKGALGLP